MDTPKPYKVMSPPLVGLVGKLRRIAYKQYRKRRRTVRLVWHTGKWWVRKLMSPADAERGSQATLEYSCEIPLPSDSLQLEAHLEREKIAYHAGAYAVVIYRPEDIRKICPLLHRDYVSSEVAIKVFRSRSFLPNDDARYVTNELAGRLGKIEVLDYPSIKQTMVSANLLALNAAVPRVFDTAILRYQDVKYLIQCVESIPDVAFEAVEAERLLSAIKATMQRENIVLCGNANGWDHRDFSSAAAYNGNVRSLKGKPYYVDVQKFRLQNPKAYLGDLTLELKKVSHFGRPRSLRGGAYFYQSLGRANALGKRDTHSRILTYDRILREAGISYHRARVLDVGCNIGSFLMHALDQGALAATGVDRLQIVDVARKMLYVLGYSRFDLFGADLALDHISVFDEAQEYDIVFFLSIRMHINSPAWLGKLKFKALLYEGHQNETMQDAAQYLESSGLRFKECRPIGLIADGDSTERPLVLVLG